MSSINDSFWKPLLLKAGQFDWWKDQFEAHVCALDGQLWSIFEMAPLVLRSRLRKAKTNTLKRTTKSSKKC
ncbi:unnamed protein product [Rhodiola kirilowii]